MPEPAPDAKPKRRAAKKVADPEPLEAKAKRRTKKAVEPEPPPEPKPKRRASKKAAGSPD
jgi:hypothetical protein